MHTESMTPLSPPIKTDEHLLSAFINGNNSAFDQLILRFQDRIYRTALGLMTHPSDAEELTQDVFVMLHRKAHQFRGDSALSSWLYRITHNLGKNMLLKRKLKQVISLDWLIDFSPHIAAHPDHSHHIELSDTNEAILRLMTHLDPLSRHILTLRELNELSYEAIAESTQLPLGTVKSRLSRAKEKLLQLASKQRLHRGDLHD